MNDFKFVSESYDIKNTSNYRLSIQFNRDGFSVLINSASQEVLQLWHFQTGSVENSIRKLYENEKLDAIRRLSFADNEIILNTIDYSIIPEKLYDTNQKGFLLENSIQIKPVDKIENQYISEINARIIYKTDKKVQSFIDLFKNNPKIKHISASLVSHCYSNAGDYNSFFIHSAGEVVHIGFLKGKDLVFFNSFLSETINETIYYCVNTSKKLAIPSNSKVFYSGELSTESKEFSQLKKYFPDLQIISNPLPFEIAGQHYESYFLNLIQPGN